MSSKVLTLLAVACVFMSIAYTRQSTRRESIPDRMNQELQSLRRISTLSSSLESQLAQHARPCSSGKTVLIGFNGCLDLVVDASQLLSHMRNDLSMTLGDMRQPTVHDKINSIPQFLTTLSQYLREGVATEKFAVNDTMFSQLVSSANKCESANSVLGGNAAIMGTRFSKLGCPVQFGGFVGSKIRDALGAHTISVADNSMLIDIDDVHLIVEYPRGSLFVDADPALIQEAGDLVAQRANRFILTQELDTRIPHRLLTESLQKDKAIRDQIGIVVLSGFHLFDGKPQESRLSEFNALIDTIHATSADTLIHLEIASFTEPQLLFDLQDTVLKHVHSLGANEQEIAGVYDLMQTGEFSQFYEHKPAIHDTLHKTRSVLSELPHVSRVHVHNIAFQAICQRTSSSVFSSPVASLLQATLAATKQACAVVSVCVCVCLYVYLCLLYDV
jgi:ADP-dependent phosphofructokinase/glucokinase